MTSLHMSNSVKKEEGQALLDEMQDMESSVNQSTMYGNSYQNKQMFSIPYG